MKSLGSIRRAFAPWNNPDAKPYIHFEHVTKRFGDFTAVNDLSLAIYEREFFALLGASGCGKSTLLRMLAGFEEPTSGRILLDGQDLRGIPPYRRPVNMMFQSYALFPHMSVEKNIAFGLKQEGMPKADIDRRVAEMLRLVKLEPFAKRKPHQLSGGQRQRVAIARCLVLEPTLVLLDEPLGALDLKLREHMKIELKQLQATFNTTFAYITHDQSEALVMSDRIAVMNQGRFEQVGSPRELYHDPATPFVASFVGEANKWRGEATSAAGGSIAVRLPTGAVIQGQGTVADKETLAFVRPEAIALAQDSSALSGLPNRFEGRVSAVLFDGANSSLLIDADGFEQPIRAVLPQAGPLAGIRVGAPVHVGWTANAMKVFAA